MLAWMLITAAGILFIVLWVRTTIDVFRRDDLSSSAKAGWAIIMFVVPFLGILVYMLARPTDAQIARRAPH